MSISSFIDQNGDEVITFGVNTGVDESRDEGFLKDKLFEYASLDKWQQARSIYDKFPDMVRIRLRDEDGVTALHVAVRTRSNDFVRELVNLVTPQDLEIRDVNGNTAFCLAAITGCRGFLQIMIQKNDNLALIHGQDGMLPVHLAAFTGYHQVVLDLSSEKLFEKMDFKDIKRLLFMAINSNMYDVAVKLVEKYPGPLSIARDDEKNLTALHMLAQKSWHFSKERKLLVIMLWNQVTKLENKMRLKLITEPSVVLFDAVKSGNFDFVKSLPYVESLVMIKDPKNGQNLLHIAVLFRQDRIVSFLRDKLGQIMIRAADNDGNNVLHFAARLSREAILNLRPDIRMQRELKWYTELKDWAPYELRTMRNKDDMTPGDVFYAEHKTLSDEVKETAKGEANSGMVVAALIVAVAFAAALTTPGDKNYNAWFTVFIMANAVALFTSSSSIVAFLAIFNSTRFKEWDSVFSLYPRLIIGKRLLFISIVTMVIAFVVASFLIFDHTHMHKWAAQLVASLGLLTIIMFLEFHLSLIDGFRHYYWVIYYKIMYLVALI